MAEEETVSLVERLGKLEQEIAQLRKSSPHWLEILKALSPIISGLSIAMVGFLLTGSINNTLQQRQLQLASVKEMRDLLLKLGDPQASLEDASATARTLSAFGSFAVPPLISILESGGETKILAAEEGLRSVGLVDRKALCSQLIEVFGNRTRLFSFETHRRTIRLAGRLSCMDAVPVLVRYGKLLGQSSEGQEINRVAHIFRESSTLSPRSLEQMASEVSASLTLLREGEANEGSTSRKEKQ